MKLYDHYFREKTAIVTGAASGIGLALAEELLHCGAGQVVLADVQLESLKEHTDRLLQQYPGRVKGTPCNVTLEHEVKAMIKEAAAWFGGRVDLLINNAGAGFAGYFVPPAQPQAMDKLGFKVQTNTDWEQDRKSVV